MPYRSGDELRSEIAQLEAKLADIAVAREKEAATARAAAKRISQLEAALNVVPVGVVLADPDGKILLGNSQVAKMLRHPVIHSENADSYGEWIAYHPDGSRVESHEYPLAQVVLGHADHAELEVHYQRGDGTRFWMRIIGEPVMGPDGTRIGAAVALVDTEVRQQLLAQQRILIGELNHRVKNAFSVVKSIVSQSLRKVGVPEGLRETIDERLDAYAKAHAKLVGSTWDRASVTSIAQDILPAIAGKRITISGPEVTLPSRQAIALSMAFYELATNAVKYGALSNSIGTVDLCWQWDSDGADNQTLRMNWVERGGPKAVDGPKKGFGSFVIQRALEAETAGRVDLSHTPDGLEWHLQMPVKNEYEEQE